MRRLLLVCCSAAFLVSAGVCNTSTAQEFVPPAPLAPPSEFEAIPAKGQPIPTRLPQQITPRSAPTPAQPINRANQPYGGAAPQYSTYAPVSQPGYVQLNSSMYPAPQPNVPHWAGVTMITNQALAPHEMLYPHTYRAMYPPFYHRVKGHWLLTPFGVKTHERWELQGTMVQVKYRSSHPLTPKFFPPNISMFGGPYR